MDDKQIKHGTRFAPFCGERGVARFRIVADERPRSMFHLVAEIRHGVGSLRKEVACATVMDPY
jgi:hypothetical protein